MNLSRPVGPTVVRVSISGDPSKPESRRMTRDASRDINKQSKREFSVENKNGPDANT
jgi:hypothetical protein